MTCTTNRPWPEMRFPNDVGSVVPCLNPAWLAIGLTLHEFHPPPASKPLTQGSSGVFGTGPKSGAFYYQSVTGTSNHDYVSHGFDTDKLLSDEFTVLCLSKGNRDGSLSQRGFQFSALNLVLPQHQMPSGMLQGTNASIQMTVTICLP